MKIFIPQIAFNNVNRKHLFILTRPFYLKQCWGNDIQDKQLWGIQDDFVYCNTIATADVYLIPLPINQYSNGELEIINRECVQYDIPGFGYISGDYGKSFGVYSHLTFFRMGGFMSQLPPQYKGFPVPLSDHYQRLYNTTVLAVREKQKRPVVGFCGHAHSGVYMRFKEQYKQIKENVSRVLEQPTRADYEPLFASAYQRVKLLHQLEQSHAVHTNFIYRCKYRAGALTQQERAQTTADYYENIKQSDYVLCVRGAGNFSVRLYETLMMGRIPIFVNTDCMLPFDTDIDWNQHVVWVEWKDRFSLADRVAAFHKKLTTNQFKDLQSSNRRLWKEQLSVNGILTLLNQGINN